MNTIDEVLQLEDVSQKIEYLKKGRRTVKPNTAENFADWNPNLHEIMTDKEKYPDRKVVTKKGEEVYSPLKQQMVKQDDKVETEPINRISIPIEQDIINTQTAFTVGTEPTIDCTPNNDAEKSLLDTVKIILKTCKIKFQNKKIVRAWLAEQEVAEYWYTADEDGFWDKIWTKIKYAFTRKNRPSKKLKCTIWSPFRGDKLYPFFDESGDFVALSREYKKKDLDDKEIECFMTVTKDSVYCFENGTNGWGLIPEKSFKHGFSKLPAIYAYRSEPYCAKIKSLRIRLEKLLSNYADCIDYHFFPLLKLFGDVSGVMGKTKDRVVKLQGQGANAEYLTWNQVPDTVKFEAETLTNMIYSKTSTPRISFEDLKGAGSVLSGVGFRYMFMGAHMAVSNHAETLGEFFQRRINFLVSASADLNPDYIKPSKTIDINTEIVPYMIDNTDDKVNTAVNAVSGGIWSRREGIMFAGNADRIESELQEIEEEQNTKNGEIDYQGNKNSQNLPSEDKNQSKKSEK